MLRGVRTVIVDEIHALARDKRGSHLALSLERLEALCEQPPVRIGLSATQRPIDEIARFLVGDAAGRRRAGRPDCTIVDVGHVRELDLAIEVPPSELSAVCSHEQWAEVYERLAELITVASQHAGLREHAAAGRARGPSSDRTARAPTRWPAITAACRGNCASRPKQRLKSGQLKAIVATASLEMGIDIGYIDLVCQIGSPRSIATFLQRVGRVGALAGQDSQGAAVSADARRAARMPGAGAGGAARRAGPRSRFPTQPLDILAQQIVAAVACEEWDEDELFDGSAGRGRIASCRATISRPMRATC